MTASADTTIPRYAAGDRVLTTGALQEAATVVPTPYSRAEKFPDPLEWIAIVIDGEGRIIMVRPWLVRKMTAAEKRTIDPSTVA